MPGQTLPTAITADVAYEDFWETTLNLPLGAADTDIYPVNMPISGAGFGVIDPDGDSPEIFFWNTTGPNYLRCPSASDGEGRGVFNTTPNPDGWEAGTKLGMYSIAPFFEGIVTGKLMRNGFLESRHFGAGIDPNSWIGTGENWNYVGNNGQKEYQYVVAGDKTGKYSKGMKVRMPRVTTAPTQMADFESSSSQYAARPHASLTNINFAGAYTVEAFVNLESYTGGDNVVLGKWDGSSGWRMQINSSGQLMIQGVNSTGGNNEWATTTASIPLGQKIHIAGTIDLGANTAVLYVNGLPISLYQSSFGGGTTLGQGAGALQLGAWNGSGFFDGQISEVRLWSTARTGVQIRDNMNKQLVGNEVGLVGYWKLNGNFNDSTANNNHLTAVNGAVATYADHPFKGVEYGIITNVSYSGGSTTITVWTGVAHNAPAENLSGVSYSAARTPYGFPAARSNWRITTVIRASITAAVTGGVIYNGFGAKLVVPSGDWLLKTKVNLNVAMGGVSANGITGGLSESSTAFTNEDLKTFVYDSDSSNIHDTATAESSTSQSAMTDWYYLHKTEASGISGGIAGGFATSYFIAESAYV